MQYILKILQHTPGDYEVISGVCDY